MFNLKLNFKLLQCYTTCSFWSRSQSRGHKNDKKYFLEAIIFIFQCVPGCSRWEYGVSLQQSPALQPFVQHEFNLEISFYDLQYEHVKEANLFSSNNFLFSDIQVYTISVPGFMSQIGGQFGFFLGLSIITMIQVNN
ncbi:unnamed protein product [Meloidogyne enterolobii]|uniref:Uncharacterized protein n=1 Tax=Meloidogyne enterolobii TaxID=390850 RepID=A0ACB1B3H0_MELEN